MTTIDEMKTLCDEATPGDIDKAFNYFEDKRSNCHELCRAKDDPRNIAMYKVFHAARSHTRLIEIADKMAEALRHYDSLLCGSPLGNRAANALSAFDALGVE